MDNELGDVLDSIGEEFKHDIMKGARHYREVNIGEQAAKLGFFRLKNKVIS